MENSENSSVPGNFKYFDPLLRKTGGNFKNNEKLVCYLFVGNNEVYFSIEKYYATCDDIG